MEPSSFPKCSSEDAIPTLDPDSSTGESDTTMIDPKSATSPPSDASASSNKAEELAASSDRSPSAREVEAAIQDTSKPSPTAQSAILEDVRTASASALAAQQTLPGGSLSNLFVDDLTSGVAPSPGQEKQDAPSSLTQTPSAARGVLPRRASSSRTINAPATPTALVLRGSGSQSDAQGGQARTSRPARWEQSDDVLLAKLVQKHGTKWQKVKNDFNEQSSTVRSDQALEARWRIMSVPDGKKAPLSPAQVLESLQKKAKPSFSPPASRPKRGSRLSLWTDEETRVMRDSLARHEGQGSLAPKVIADFFKHFKTSTRTRGAIRNRIYFLQTVEPRARGDLESGEEDEEEEDEEEEGEASEEEEEVEEKEDSGMTFDATSLTRDQAAAMVAQSLFARGSSQQAQGSGPRPTNKHLSGALAGWAGESSMAGFGTPGARHQQQQDLSPQPQSPAAAAPSATDQDVDVCITYSPNGIIITDLPKHYEAKIYSPTKVKITRCTKAATQTEVRPPAFHFKILDDGALHAVRLPEGTTTQMAAVPADEEEQVEGEAARKLVETRFVAMDGYTVKLRGAL